MVEKINKNILGEILDKYDYWISTNDWTDVFNSVQAQYSDKTFTQFVAVLDELEIEYLPYINKIYRQMYTGRENLKLELPDNIEFIWPDAFAGTVGAKVYIPKSVSRIGIQHYTDDLKFFFEGELNKQHEIKGNWLAAFDPDKTSNSFYTETTRQEFRGM